MMGAMSRPAGSAGVVLVAMLATGFACGARNLVEDAGGGPAGSSGGGSPATDANPGTVEEDVISDFRTQVARINLTGTPPRSGYWYSYNDASPTCVQVPAPAEAYDVGVPPMPSPGLSGGFALRGVWRGCNSWGAGIGAALNLSEPIDGAAGTKRPYDLSAYKGFAFWGMAAPGSNGRLRFKVVMRAETPLADGGDCDETIVGINKCSDSWGQTFALPSAGHWQQIVVLFSDTSRFRQEGWGALYPWNPADVTGIQIQSQGAEIDQSFDFWIDDVYLFR
jgi:hypothetical protein